MQSYKLILIQLWCSMISKILDSGYSTSTGFPSSVLLPHFSKGFDKDVLHKQASCFEAEYDKFERKPKHQYIHLISVAAGETYGHNSRADFYNGKSYDVTVPKPKRNGPTIITLDGGISEFHKTFMQEGGCYTEHCNKHDGAKPQGYIVAEKYNEPMHRAELIIGVRDGEWDDDIQRLSQGKPLKFSIGADVSRDICSICGNIARTEGEHCDHYFNQRGGIDEEGNSIYVISDTGVYHDISRVRVPAERIAFSIKKVASDNYNTITNSQPTIQPKLSSAKYFLKTASAKNRFDTLSKLSKIEKQIPAQGKLISDELLHFFKLKKKSSHSFNTLQRFTDFSQEHELLGQLNKEKCILSPSSFIEVFAPNCSHIVPTIEDDLKHCFFSRMLHSPDVDEFCNSKAYEPEKCLDLRIINEVDKVKPLLGVAEEDLVKGLTSCTCQNKASLQSPSNKIILTIEIEKSPPRDITKEYGDYFLSACEGLSDEEKVVALLQQIIN